MTEHVRSTFADGVLELVIDRVDKKNALTNAMYLALADGLERAERKAVRAVLFRSEGDTFTSGNDLADFAAAARGEPSGGGVSRFLRALAGSTRPLVAAVQGRAVGVGATLLLHCDYVLLAEGAQLSTPFVNLALVPEAGSSLLLPARIGHVRAFAAFALGEAISAENALAWGLANTVTPAAELVAAARDVAARIARQPAGAVAATKALMKPGAAVQERMALEGEQFAQEAAQPGGPRGLLRLRRTPPPRLLSVRLRRPDTGVRVTAPTQASAGQRSSKALAAARATPKLRSSPRLFYALVRIRAPFDPVSGSFHPAQGLVFRS